MEVKNKFFLLMLASALFIGFTSCGDDDDDSDYAKEIAGTYKGDLTIENMGTIPDVIITVTRNSNSKVTLTLDTQNLPILSDLGFGVAECPSDVTFKNGIYSITGKTTWMAMATIPIPIEVTNSTINSTGQADININVVVDVEGLQSGTFNIAFTGNKE
jgi:hypothetical protein